MKESPVSRKNSPKKIAGIHTPSGSGERSSAGLPELPRRLAADHGSKGETTQPAGRLTIGPDNTAILDGGDSPTKWSRAQGGYDVERLMCPRRRDFHQRTHVGAGLCGAFRDAISWVPTRAAKHHFEKLRVRLRSNVRRVRCGTMRPANRS